MRDAIREVATVKWFNNDKGYGFLLDSEGGDVFVHYRSITPGEAGYKTLSEGDLVDFLPIKTDRGWSAAEVSKR